MRTIRVAFQTILAVFLGLAWSAGTAQTAPSGYDVILLAGQSNMVGYGQGPDNATDAAVSPRVFMWNANTGAIVPAVDPLVQNQAAAFVGPGLTFAKAYAASIAANRNVLLVGSADGGTSFASGRWQAPSGDLATTAVSRANAAMVAAGAGAKFVGILWHQGESDLSAPTPPATYQADLLNLISYFRTNIAGASSKTPFVVGEFTYPWMIDTINSGVNVAVQQGIIAVFHNLPDTVNNTAWVASAGLAGDVYAGDVHFSALSQRQFGRRYADRFFLALQGIPQAETSQEIYNGSFSDDGRSYNNNTFPVNFPGVVTGTVTVVTDPVRGNVAQISGGKGYITYSVPATTFNGDYTKLVWFKPGAANTLNNLISGINTGQSHFLAAVTGNGIVTICAGHQASSSAILYIDTTVSAPAGTWMQIGLVYSAVAKTMTAYVNGVAVETANNVPEAPALSGAAVPLNMGSYGGTAGVDGSMASNRVWTSALTAAQIAVLYSYELNYRAGW